MSRNTLELPAQHSGRPLRIAVAGVGSLAQRVLIPGLAACPDAELVALFGPQPDKTRRIAAAHGVPEVFSDYAAMLDRTELDAVFVATPNDVHFPMVMAALERGLAVACEKPLATSVAQARAMCQAARRAGVSTAVNFSYRSTTPMRHVAALVREGMLGTLYHLDVAFLQNIKADPSLPLAWRMQRERGGGGTVYDLGPHVVDLLRWWVGDILAVCGATRIAITERRREVDGAVVPVTGDDVASFVVRFGQGAIGTVQLSQIAHGRQNYRRIGLYGSDGSILTEEDRTFGPEVRIARPGDPIFTAVPPPPEVQVSFEDYPCVHLSCIVAALRGEGDFPGFEDGLRAQEAIEAVERSAAEGRWLQLPLT